VVGAEAPNISSQQGVGVQQSGPFRDDYSYLTLDIKSGRTDWVMSVSPEKAMEVGFPSFDDFAGGLRIFRELVVPWARTRENVKRVAFGAVVSIAVPDRVTGYRELQPLLPAVQLNIERSSDLFYQINRHATSRAVENLHINRLCNWGVVIAQMARLQLVGGPAQVVVGNEGAALSAVRVQMDINTDADRTEPLPSGRMEALLGELLAYAEQIADRGDVQ
jgi:hypothetical protein